jgi:2-keto-3-deoxy-L-fuconate dehydrogenase
MHLPFRVDGRKALVTGGASGIGAATCRALHAAGAQIAIADIDQAGAEALSRELSGASVLILDITDEALVSAWWAAWSRPRQRISSGYSG